jgi:hypothetical protein
MHTLAAAGEPITSERLASALDGGGALEAPGGWPVFVAHLERLESTGVTARWHARNVRRLGLRRRFKRLARRLLDDHDDAEDRQAMLAILAELSTPAGGR